MTEQVFPDRFPVFPGNTSTSVFPVFPPFNKRETQKRLSLAFIHCIAFLAIRETLARETLPPHAPTLSPAPSPENDHGDRR